VASEAERKGTCNWFCKHEAPKAPQAIRLAETAFAAKAAEANRAAPLRSNLDFFERLEGNRLSQTALAAFAADLILYIEAFLYMPRVQVRRDRAPFGCPAR
jgi:hypothetical protein